jgi:hypothetical protein
LQGVAIFRLLWRVDIKSVSHAVFVFGTSVVDVLYVTILAFVFWYLMRIVVFGFRHDPHHS